MNGNNIYDVKKGAIHTTISHDVEYTENGKYASDTFHVNVMNGIEVILDDHTDTLKTAFGMIEMYVEIKYTKYEVLNDMMLNGCHNIVCKLCPMASKSHVLCDTLRKLREYK